MRNTTEPIRLEHQDRLAFAYRIAGAISGLSLVFWSLASSSWERPAVLVLLLLVIVGGALLYHLLTSIARCPRCRALTTNFAIGRKDPRKLFHCAQCESVVYLTEGFFWQSDSSG